MNHEITFDFQPARARFNFTAIIRMALAFVLIATSTLANTPPTRSLTPAEEAAFKEFIKYWEGQDICWKATETRGVGKIPTECNGKDKDAGLCYDKCPAGMKGVGPVCWQNCPDGYTDTGGHCAKPKAYGRGAGYAWKGSDGTSDDGMFKRCEADNGKGNCEKDGAIVYPKCKEGYRKVGCCTCSPVCPTGMTDIGVSCQKKSETRGVGKPMSCAGGLDSDAGLCYPKCAADSEGVGPVCWGKCTGEYPVNCGAACAKDKRYCATAVVDMVLSTGQVALNVASLVLTAGAATAAVKAGVTAAKTAGTTITKKVVSDAAIKAAKTTLQNNATKIGVSLTADALAIGARALAEAKEEDKFDYTVLDPTGIAAVVNAFNKPICGK